MINLHRSICLPALILSEGIFIPHSHYTLVVSVNVDYYIFTKIRPHACQWIPYMVAQHVSLNLAIQDVAYMAAKTCSLGSLCKL